MDLCVGISGTMVTHHINALITEGIICIDLKVLETSLPVELSVHITLCCNYFCPFLKQVLTPKLKRPVITFCNNSIFEKMSAAAKSFLPVLSHQ